MGKGDRRNSLKMKQRRARAHDKARKSRPRAAATAAPKASKKVAAAPEAEKSSEA